MNLHSFWAYICNRGYVSAPRLAANRRRGVYVPDLGRISSNGSWQWNEWNECVQVRRAQVCQTEAGKVLV
jgi:hypothetical protein